MFLNIQLDYLLWLQNFREMTNGLFDSFFLAVTHFGESYIAILFLAFVYWSLNRKVGEFLLLSYAFGAIVNQFMKMMFCVQRPWILNDKIKPVPDALPHATGYSFPSGHTTCATAIWGGLVALFWDNKAIRYVLSALVFLVLFSRNYLGVHTPQDVLVALAVGIVIIIALKKMYEKTIVQGQDYTKIFLTAMVLSVLSIIVVKLKPVTLNYIDGVNTGSQFKDYCSNMGCVFGIIIGWYYCKMLIPFVTENISMLKRLSRYLLGSGLLVLLMMCKNTFITEFGTNRGCFIYSFVVVIFLTFVYPWIFTKIEQHFDADKIANIFCSKNKID